MDLPSAAQSIRSLQEYEQHTLLRTFGLVARMRLLVLPAIVLVALGLVLADGAPWRWGAVGVVGVLLVYVSFAEYVRFRRHGLGTYTIAFNAVFTVVVQLALVVLTGGLASPFLPAVVVVAAIWSVLASPRRVMRVVWGLQVPCLWLLALLQAGPLGASLRPAFLVGFADPGPGPGIWVAVSIYTLLLLALPTLGMRIREVLLGVVERTFAERDRALALYAEHSSTLGSLSSEIAHELKNPLASIKGLAALLARDLSGKSAERLAVLRREVDRMQATLEEFLNFSRPLVPLSRESVDLRALAADVVALHEGMAAERGIALRLTAGQAAQAHCDPRKIRQVLVNLVQNAIEASGEGNTVEVVVTASDGIARVRVLDRGAGLPVELAARIFEAGVTSKPDGSGIGLPIARSLARQHGGELALQARSEGGTEARLEIPIEGPHAGRVQLGEDER